MARVVAVQVGSLRISDELFTLIGLLALLDLYVGTGARWNG